MKYYRFMIAVIVISALFTGCKKEKEETNDPVLVEKYLPVSEKSYTHLGDLYYEIEYEYDDFLRVKTEEITYPQDILSSRYKEMEYDEQNLITEIKTFSKGGRGYMYEVFTHGKSTIESIYSHVDSTTMEEEFHSRGLREYNNDGYLVRLSYENDEIGDRYFFLEKDYYYDDLNNQVRAEEYYSLNGEIVLISVVKDIVYDDMKSPYIDVVKGYGNRSYQAGNEVFSMSRQNQQINEREIVTNIEYNEAGYPVKMTTVISGYETIREFEYKIVVVLE